ncbi:MAG TPA: hypothetical protein VN688_29535 [Gemmataceae bacterium]|nr:hypothetical protein [Gemmataceae bacterium]
MIQVTVDPTNPGQFFACCGLLELANRLWEGAEGWFEGPAFCIKCDGTLVKLLTAAKSIQLDGSAITDSEDEESEEDESFEPLDIIAPIKLRLDWWHNKGLKPWAGSMNARVIMRAMCCAINADGSDPMNQEQVVYDPQPETTIGAGKQRAKKQKKREPFYFDSRRGANCTALDVGFVPDSLKKLKTMAYPVVEALAMIGLQRCRPLPTKFARVFDYFTWSQPVSPSILAAVVCGLVVDRGTRRFRFANVFRTGQRKHKAFAPASPLSGDSNE